MDATGIEDLFAPFGRVNVRRMFSGHGVYADGLFFAIFNRGEIFLKTDEAIAARLSAAGSKPFTYTHGKRGEVATSLWALPATALEDEDELREWCGLALAVARRKAVAKKPRAKSAGAPASRKPARK